MKTNKINIIDLFAGCGGLTEGFEQSKHYNLVSCVEWDKAPIECLRNRLKSKWKLSDSESKIIRFDIQRYEELIHGWQGDPIYGSSVGLDSLVRSEGGKLDLIIGGPPCQAYSIAGRVRDKNGMKNDYRNYLFESYLAIAKFFRPKAFVFENVPGLLSARPGDGSFLIADKIREEFYKAGYVLINDLKDAVIDMTEYGIPQNRKRVIILGINKDFYPLDKASSLVKQFYSEILPSFKEPVKTVRDAIGDLPKLFPLPEEKVIKINGKNFSHTLCKNPKVLNHNPRYASLRDIRTFQLLESDIERGNNKYITTDSLKQLYTEITGKVSNVHKFHVLRWDRPSNLIPAHLYKDGLRHIHPDSEQARSITVREAARLQTFPDDFEFISNTALDYKMIGNAVPPKFAQKVADAVYKLLFT